MKLKKFTVIFLTFIYLLVVSGVAFNIHYCKGKLNGISLALGQKHDGCCGKKKMTKKKCCKETTSVIKINDTQYSSESLKTPGANINTIAAYFVQFNVLFIKTPESKNYISIHAPPELYQNPIYLQHRILII